MKPALPMDGPVSIPRRQFLLSASAAVIVVATSDLAGQALKRAVVKDELFDPLLSAAFVAEADRLASPDALHRLVAADSLSSGDHGLAGSDVLVMVEGFHAGAARGDGPVSVGVNVLYQIDGVPTPYLAFTHAAERGLVQATPPRPTPVSVANSLELTISSRLPRTLQPDAEDELAVKESRWRSMVRLETGSDRTSMKLRCGTYFLALRSEARDGAPEWQKVRARFSGGKAELFEQGGSEPQPVSFEYVVLSVQRP